MSIHAIGGNVMARNEALVICGGPIEIVTQGY
jgi:hypothetical protein